MNLKRICQTVLLLLCLQMNSFAQTKVVCVGNSITEGFGLSYGQKAWPAQLGDLLGSGYNVINRGRSGLTMLKSSKWGDGSSRSYWDTDTYQYAKNDRPDILIIALGTNDAGGDVWTNAQSFKSDYITMINEFRAMNNRMKIYTCLPPYVYNAGQNNTLEQNVIPAIQQVAAATGATVIDLHGVTANHRNDLYNDDLHPNVDGAALLARTIYNSVTRTAANIIPYAQDKYGWRLTSELSITQGESFALGPQSTDSGNTWYWTGPNGFTSNNREININNATAAQDGTYTVTFTASNGQRSTAAFNVHVWLWNTPIIVPYVLGGNGWQQDTQLSIAAGTNFSIGPQEGNGYDDGSSVWMWTGPNNFTSYDRQININNASDAQAGTYQVTFSDQFGRRAIQDFQINLNGNNNTPGYSDNGPAITPYIRNSYGDWYRDDVIQLYSGDTFSFGPQVDGSYNWSWTGPNGFTYNDREFTINNVNVNQAGVYRVTHRSQNGAVSTHEFTVYVDGRSSANEALPTYPANNIADAAYNAFLDGFLIRPGEPLKARDNQGIHYAFRYGYRYDGNRGDILYCWPHGLVIMMLEDRYRFRGDESVKPLLTKILDTFSWWENNEWIKDEGVVSRATQEKFLNLAHNDQNISCWTWNFFNDDLLWMILPYARGYLMTHQKRFLDQAKWVWDYLMERGWDNEMGGGYWWSMDNLAKSGLSNNPAMCLSVYLYEATGEQKYLDQAKKTFDWVYTVLRNPDGSVDEQINIERTAYPQRAEGYNAYNAGTFIEGASGLYRITGDRKYLNAARETLDWIMTNDTNNDGLISRNKNGGTYQSELARGAAFLMEAAPELWNTQTTYGKNKVPTTYYEWMRKNADAAWNTRDTRYNISNTEWAKPTVFNVGGEAESWACELWVNMPVMVQVTPATNPGNNGNYLGQNSKITPYILQNGGAWQQTAAVAVNRGNNVTFGPQPVDNNNWTWTGPNGFNASTREITLGNIQENQTGIYTATYASPNGRNLTQTFNVDMNGIYDASIAITPYVSDRYGWQQKDRIGINVGESFSLGPQANVGGNWSWTGPDGFTSNDREITINNANLNKNGTYTVTLTTNDGRKNKLDIHVMVLGVAKPRIIPYMMGNNGWQETTTLYLNSGNNFSVGPQVEGVNAAKNTVWSWTGPNGFTSEGREFTRTNVNNSNAGVYTARFTDMFGRRMSQDFTVYVDGATRARAIIPAEEEELSGIKEVENNGKAYDIYDLQGRKVATPVPGQIYIVNGRKIVVEP